MRAFVVMCLAAGISISAPVARAADTAEEAAFREFMRCVGIMAVWLEPSGDAPEDIARAAVFACQQEEVEAAALVSDSSDATSAGMTPERIRQAGMSYGAGQAIVARMCRVTGHCGLVKLVQ